MRLIYKEGKLAALFTLTWEVAFLMEQGERWIPFSLVGQTVPIGEIHARLHCVRLYPGHEVADRQMVVLSPPE